MDINEIIFDNYVICPICHRQLKTINGTHLKRYHEIPDVYSFKIEFGIPMHVALTAKNVRSVMVKNGKKRSSWFRENVMPIGIEYSKKGGDLVPKELREFGGQMRRGKSWVPGLLADMKSKGWLKPL
jgi:hypothetical protein